MNYFSDEKPGVAEACFYVLGRTKSGKILGSTKRCISLVRQPSEEVVILQTSQIENTVLSTESWGSSRSFSVRLKIATGILLLQEVRTRVSVQLESGSFLMTELCILLHYHTWQPHTTLSPIITAVEFFHSVLANFSYQCVKGIFHTLSGLG